MWNDWGWNAHWEEIYHEVSDLESESDMPGRVLRAEMNRCLLATPLGERMAEPRIHQLGTMPVPGDWVTWQAEPYDPDRAVIGRIWPRKSKLSRKASGQSGKEQIIAANVDTVFIVTSFNRDLNPSRLERYLTMVWQSGAAPVILLTKIDLDGDREEARVLIEDAAPGVDIHLLSAVTGEGLDALAPYLGEGRTVVVTGSSGVGKSTLINRLTGAEQQVREVREDDARGRHTTTARALLRLPRGGVIVDTPGLRELSPWAGQQALDTTFADIEALSFSCRFRDCQHENEPGCAVVLAVEQGDLERRRLDNYHKMQREVERLSLREDPRGRFLERAKDKAFHKAVKRHVNAKKKMRG